MRRREDFYQREHDHLHLCRRKTVSAEYTYAGYQPKRNDEGEIRSVRYQFETTSADAPKYVQFNDHGHEPGEAEHFHIYFGNDGFDALMSGKTNPFL